MPELDHAPFAVSAQGDALRVAFGGAAGATTFELRVDRSSRLRVGMVFPVGNTVVDVSVQPVVAARAMHDAVPDPTQRATVVAACAGFCRERGAWHPRDGVDPGLEGVLGGASFPLLGAAYDHGAAALGQIPRWVTEVLIHARPHDAARAAFGAAATRANARAVPRSLLAGPGRPPCLAGLGLAMAGASRLEPDQLAAVLDAAQDNGAELTSDDVRRLRTVVAQWDAPVAARLLRDAAADATRTQRLVAATVAWVEVGRHLMGRVPNRVDELVAALHARMPVDPAPWAGEAGAAPRPARRAARRATPADGQAPRRRGGRAVPSEPLPNEPATNGGAPREVVRDAVPQPQRFVPEAPVEPLHAPALRAPRRRLFTTGPLPRDPRLVPLDGHVTGGIRLVLPRTVAELATWGSRLDNCLASYGEAAMAGDSLLVGVEVHDVLTYCVELRPNGAVRQFVGRQNRPPEVRHEWVVMDLLTQAMQPR